MRSDAKSPSDNFVDLIHECDLLFSQAENPPEFAQEMLRIAVQRLEVTAAALVELDGQNLRVLAEHSLGAISLDGSFRFDPGHLSLLAAAIQKQTPQVESGRFVPVAGLKQHSLVINPIPGQGKYALELFELERLNADQLSALKEGAAILIGYFNRFHEAQAARNQPAVTPEFWKNLDPFLIRLQQSLDLKRTVAIAVNDGRFLIGCDRVSVAIKQGNRTKIVGISGQDAIQNRATLVKLLGRSAEVVCQLGTPVTYQGRMEEVPPQLEASLIEYLSESRIRMVQFIPLRQPRELALDDDHQTSRAQEAERPLLGVMIVEQATDSRPKPGVQERAELIAAHLETALANCERHESIFLLPVLRAFGRSVRWFKGRRFWTAMAVLGVLTLVSLGLWLLPWEYRVEGEGLAMPVTQHEIFAPWDADVKEIHVQSGQEVKTGDLLLTLDSDELNSEEIRTSTTLMEKQKLALSLTHQQHQARRKNDLDELARLEAEYVKTKVEIDGAAALLEKVHERIRKLKVLAPADGVVATFQLEQLLQNRPVRRGELLLQIMDPKGPWRLELEIPEYRMGHLLRAQQAADSQGLDVDYVLATAVEQSHQGKLTEVATRSNETQPDGMIVQAYVEIDPADLGTQNIGAEVIAKVHCGKKSLFYVLFGDVVEFLQRKLWL